LDGQTNMELMKTLDDAWNSQDWDMFEERHELAKFIIEFKKQNNCPNTDIHLIALLSTYYQ
jgi:chorismate mutase